MFQLDIDAHWSHLVRGYAGDKPELVGVADLKTIMSRQQFINSILQ